MRLEQILQRLVEEKRFASRFPVRLILVDQMDDYQELVFRLKNACDVTIDLSEFCSAEDVYPSFRNLRKRLDQFKERQVLLLSMGEYLRLGFKRELQQDRSQFPAFWQSQQDASSKTRVIVPMFAVKEIFERVVPSVDERQSNFVWELTPGSALPRTYDLTVYSPQFSTAVLDDMTVTGFQKWLKGWQEKLSRGNCSLITALYANAENTNGIINIRVVDSPFEYVARMVSDGDKLEKRWGRDDQWAGVILDVINNASFTKTIEKVLNVRAFDPTSILAQWDIMSEKQKWLAWIWNLMNDTNDYCGYVFRNAADSLSVERDMWYTILSTASSHPEWIGQYKQAVTAMGDSPIKADWFDKLDALPSLETKLQILTCKTHEERTYAVRIVSAWMRRGGDKLEIGSLLQDKFALLAAYLCNDNMRPELVDYFRWYRDSKIKNQLSESGPVVNLEAYDSRFAKLKQYSEKDCFVLWVDGMGCEWLPLLLQCIKMKSTSALVSSEIATCVLPSETCFNEQWNDLNHPYEKWNKLDMLAHKGTPDDRDYYSCVDYQLSIIADAAHKALDLLNSHDYVIITADHGSSRLAALSFHSSIGIAPPQGATVRSYGRYCELPGEPSGTDMLPSVRHVKNDNNNHLVLATHEHYSQSGNAAGGNTDENAMAGEVHGGMTPEEYLVPIVVLQRTVTVTSLDYSLEASTVFREGGQARLSLTFSRPIHSLEVTAECGPGVCHNAKGTNWTVTFLNIASNAYTIEVIADGSLLSRRERFSVKTKGISINNDLFGGSQ